MNPVDRFHNLPEISSDDLAAFFHNHFSGQAVAQFDAAFIHPKETNQVDSNGLNAGWYDEAEEEDELGYYEDGVKRTLTDEQIEIFRHSEIRELEKAKAKGKGLSKDDPQVSDNAVSTRQNRAFEPAPFSTHNKKKKKKGGRRQQPEPKPDLRKRTWDVVDKGLDSLDYD